MLNRSEVIVVTNKQTDAAENTHAPRFAVLRRLIDTMLHPMKQEALHMQRDRATRFVARDD